MADFSFQGLADCGRDEVVRDGDGQLLGNEWRPPQIALAVGGPRETRRPPGHLLLDASSETFYMLYACPKNEQEDLTAQQLRILARLVREEFG